MKKKTVKPKTKPKTKSKVVKAKKEKSKKSGTAPASVKIEKKPKEIDKAYLDELAEKVYNYDDEEFKTEVFEKHQPLEVDEEDEDRDDDGDNDDQVQAIYKEYQKLIEDEDCTLFAEISKLTDKERECLDNEIYNNVYEGVN